MITPTRERLDWTLLIFIIPIGIILMLVAGQFAIQLVPKWSVNAGMRSNLDPSSLPNQQGAPVQPISPAILTPLGWLDTFLTPGAGSEDQLSFPSFVVFEPSAAPEVTLPPPTVVTDTPATPATDAPTETLSPPTATPTKKTTATLHTIVPTATTVVPTSTTAVPTTATTVVPTSTTVVPTTATTVVPTSTTVVPTTATTVVPTSTTVVPTTATTVVPTSTTAVPTTATTVVPTATPTVPTSTPVGTRVVTIPTTFNIGTPDDAIYTLQDGKFIVIDLGANPIEVKNSSETNYYDMVYYEMENPVNKISMDRVIIGISTYPNGSIYYTVFNWGNVTPDLNSNIGIVASTTGTENDNQQIATTYLYGLPATRTGVAIDVDNLINGPPVGSYQYLVIEVPKPVSDGADIDSVQVIEVQILSAPAPSGSSIIKPRISPVITELVLPVEETPTSLPGEVSVLPVEEALTLLPAEPPALPVEEVRTLLSEQEPSSP